MVKGRQLFLRRQFPIPPAHLEDDPGINSRRCLLVDESQSAVLELDPFVIVTSEGRLQQPDIFFFDGVFSSGRANFMSYHVPVQRLCQSVQPGIPAASKSRPTPIIPKDS